MTGDTTGATGLLAFVEGALNTAVTDSLGNVFTLVADYADSMRIFACANPIVGANHTFTSTGSNEGVGFLALRNVACVVVDKNANIHSGDAATLQSGPVTTTAAYQLVVAIADLGGGPSNPSIDSGFTIDGGVAGILNATYGLFVSHAIVASPSTLNPTWTWTPHTSGQRLVTAVFR